MSKEIEGLEALPSDLEVNQVKENPDGSADYEIMQAQPESQNTQNDFNDNLADTLDKKTLENVSSYVLDLCEKDERARESWLEDHNEIKKYLGFDIDAIKPAFTQSSKGYDTTLSTALIRFCATSRAELLPVSGPCGYQIVGQASEELESIAKTRSQWINYFLTVKDNNYYQDYYKFLFYLGFYGSIVKKVYYDDHLKRPISRFILPEEFLLNVDCSSVAESDRLTHILKMSSREVLIAQQNKKYRDVKLPYLENEDKGDTKDKEDKKSNSDDLHIIYESHIYLDLESFSEIEQKPSVGKPYIVVIDKESREVLSIKRNWNQGDESFIRRKYFIHYQYFTGFDIWGLGIARIAGTNAMSNTSILRQVVDAAILQNIPSGFIQEGSIKSEKKNIVLGPGEFKSLHAINGDLNSVFKTLPANGPSPALMQLRQEVISQMQDQLSTTELGMLASKENIPTGTAVAFLEENNKVNSSVMRSLHHSFSEELRLLDEIFKEYIDREEFYIEGEQHIITKEHFSDDIQIVPVSDPSVNSSIQKIMKAEAVFQTASQMPDKINMLELLKTIFKAQGLNEQQIENVILKEEEEEIQPLDPITENMNLMQDKPVKASIEQNHDAHIAVHSAIQNPASKAHIQEHMALKFLVQMQQEMEIDLSTVDMDDVQIQNTIAIKAAEAVKNLNLGEEGEDNELDPNQLLLADIEQKKEANQVRREIADKKLESDAFKSQIKFEESKMKIQANKEQALLEAKLSLKQLKEKRY